MLMIASLTSGRRRDAAAGGFSFFMRMPALFLATVGVACTAMAATTGDVSFAKGQWDTSRWTPIRLPHQTTLKAFTQRDASLGTQAFTASEIKAELDNVLLMTDTGTTEGEFAVTFSLNADHGTAPGVFISPVVKDGVLDTSLVVFVASYTMAVWTTQTDPVTGATKYKHLVRVNRWSAPNQQHVLRCRYSKARKSVVLRLDQGDPLLLRDVGITLYSLVGIWGCHGPCDFYSVTFPQQPVLAWSASDPKKK